jgi:thiol-disulfide isomerase/thioredoxin
MGYGQTPVAYQPDFSLTDKQLEDGVFKAKEEIWVIDFWASWCGPCIQSVPYMKELHDKYSAKGVRFISVSWDKKESQWRLALDKLQMPWQHLLAIHGSQTFYERRFPHRSIPTAFVISKSGKAKKVGDIEMLEAAIVKALQASK